VTEFDEEFSTKKQTVGFAANESTRRFHTDNLQVPKSTRFFQ